MRLAACLLALRLAASAAASIRAASAATFIRAASAAAFILAAPAAAVILAGPAAAFIDPGEVLPDPDQEARARAITAELRCVVCRGQALDESDAPIARDLRAVVREQVVAGSTDAEIFAYLTERYGEYVLYRPPFTLANAGLWLAGPAFLLVGGGIAFAFVRRRTASSADRPALNEDERRRLARLLEE